MDDKEIGRRIAALRKKRGLTMRDFGRAIGLSQGQVSRLENGRQGFRSELLVRMARVLGVGPHELYLTEATAAAHGRPPALSRALRSALADPEFVSAMERIVAVYRRSPEAVEAVVRILLGP